MSDEQNTQGTALTTAEPRKAPAKARLEADGGGVMAIMPRSIEEASRYAQGLIQANQVPDAFRYDGKKANDVNPPLVMMGVLKSLEIGLPPQTGLAFLLPLNGRFSVWGDGAWALVQRGAQLEDHKVEWGLFADLDAAPTPATFEKEKTPLDKWPSEYGCRVSMWRRGQKSPYVWTYTVGMARRANLWNNTYKKPWITDPERMLFNRARSVPMRDGFADALFGLIIAEEQHPDYSNVQSRVAARRVDNSALDDDLPTAPAIADQSGDHAQAAEAYKSGLAAIATLEDLEAWQTRPDHVRLIAILQKSDERAYNALIAANAARFQEIEAADRAAEREQFEQREREREAGEDAPDGEKVDG